MSGVDVAALRAAAEVLPDEWVEHEGDCLETLCAECGHCCHSIAACDHDCDERGGGCANAVDTAELVFRRGVLALLDALEDEQWLRRSLEGLIEGRGSNDHIRVGALRALLDTTRPLGLDGPGSHLPSDLPDFQAGGGQLARPSDDERDDEENR